MSKTTRRSFPKSIRTRFLAVFLIPSLALGGVLAFTFYLWTGLRLQNLRFSTIEMASAAAGVTRTFLDTSRRSALLAAESLARKDLSPADRSAFLAEFLSAHPFLEGAYYLSGSTLLHVGPGYRSPTHLRESPPVKAVLSGNEHWALGSDSGGTSNPQVLLAVACDRNAEREGILVCVLRTLSRSRSDTSPSLASLLPRPTAVNVQIHIVDAAGSLVYSDPLEENESGEHLLSEHSLTAARNNHSSRAVELKSRPASGNYIGSFEPIENGWVAAAVGDTPTVLAPIHHLELMGGLVLGAALLLGFLFIWWDTGALLQSIRRLRRASQAVAGGDIGYRVRWTTGSEMDGLVEAFNEMAERLEAHQDLLHDRNLQLNVLLSVVERLRTERDPQDLLRRITQDAVLLTSAGVAFLAQMVDDKLYVKEGWNGSNWIALERFWSPGEGVPGWVYLHQTTITSETETVGPPPEIDGDLGIRNYICSPIDQPKSSVAGVLFVGNKPEEDAFTEDDSRIIELLARHAGVALEVEAAFQRERRIAATLQKAMLPDVDPELGGLSIAREYQAASDETELGGDFYDVIELPGGRIGLVIADVSGKGLRAAVQTAAVKYALRAYALENADPASVLSRVNDCCCSGPSTRGFVTLFLGVIDRHTWQMTYANAGHQPPLLRHANGNVEVLSSDGVALGVVESSLVRFQGVTVDLRPGDTLVLYTDGLSEARRGDDFLDIEGLQQLLGPLDLGARETAQQLVAAATAFSEGGLRDDVALLVVKMPTPLPAPGEMSRLVSSFEM